MSASRHHLLVLLLLDLPPVATVALPTLAIVFIAGSIGLAFPSYTPVGGDRRGPPNSLVLVAVYPLLSSCDFARRHLGRE